MIVNRLTSRFALRYASVRPFYLPINFGREFSKINGPISMNNESTTTKPTMLTKIKDGVSHYWHGSKLLAYETKISSRLLFKLMRGEKLIRREQRQLRRTTSDLLRLVPFMVIVAVPFLEFALPLILKFFPNMLPSTFEDKNAFEMKRKRQIKVKLEMAKFLQETMADLAARNSGIDKSENENIFESFRKIRITGETLNDDEIISLSRTLSDSITLENLPRAQLVGICKYMGINAFGTDTFLRYQIRNRLSKIRKDDELIDQEGAANLTSDELIHACNSRGIKISGKISRAKLERELAQWLNLHLRHEIPSVILILSRALAMAEPSVDPEEALQSAIMSLPEVAVEEAKLEAVETSESSKSTEAFQQKLQVLEQQEELITQELAQEKQEKNHASDTVNLSPNDIEQISEAISMATSTVSEKEDLEELKEVAAEYKEDSTVASRDQDKTTEILEQQVDNLIQEIEKELSFVENNDSGSKLNLLNMNENGQLTVDQLENILRLLKNPNLNQDKISALIQQFDKDGDGKILIRDIIEMAKKFEEQEGTGVVLDNSAQKKI